MIGEVIDEVGDPFPGVNVTAVNTTTFASYYSVTGDDGEYNISLPTGRYNISASLINYSANVSYVDVLIGEGESMTLHFQMAEILGILTGHVTNGTAPVTGVRVVLTNGTTEYSAFSVSPLGEYLIDRISPGVYVAHAERSGYWTTYNNQPITIVRGQVTQLDFIILEQPTTLYGRVTFEGNPVRDVQIAVEQASFSTSSVTDANGNYTFSNLPMGTYSVTFHKDGYRDRTIQISLQPFEPKRYDLTLERVPSEGSGGGFVPGFDLPHSLMITGLGLSLILLCVSIYVRHKVVRRPDMLAIEEEGEKVEEGSEEKK